MASTSVPSNPPSKRSRSDAVWTVLTALAAVSVAVALYLSLVWAPTAVNFTTETERLSQRIFYFHVASGWVGFFAFFVTAVSGAVYLITRRRRWDAVALSSAELGVTFTLANLFSGMVWAQTTWGKPYPIEDPRINTSTIVVLVYIAYLMLRNAIADPERRARLASVYGIVGFLSVPITFLSIRIWRTIHPAVIGTGSETAQGGFDLAPDMVVALLFSIFAFTVMYAALLRWRLKLEDLRDQVDGLKALAAGGDR
ncbi:MAG: cytochrome c biogenesis protein [Caldilineales bacterium]|nr:cytochrome c biogenesis protein [Caldilineales bacterium]MDW8316638.1 cytochrome c biogenesis protein [Anaerolineae bacterium]